MAKIPQQITADVNHDLGDRYQRASGATPDAFGAGVGAALQNLGNTGVQVARGVMREVTIAKDIENQTAATTAVTDFTRRSGELWARYGSLQGQEAVNGYEPFRASLDNLQREVIDAAPNDPIRRALTAQIGSRTAEMQNGASRFYATQARQANVQASEGAAAVAINDANLYRQDPQRLDAAVETGRAQVRRIAELQGWDASTLGAKIAEYNGRAYGAVISNMAASDPGAAAALFERVRPQMDASTQARIAESLRPEVRRQQATQQADVAIGATRSNGTVMDRVFRAESGDRNVRNPTPGSTASGPGQITDGLWNTYAARLGLPADQRNTRAGAEAVWSAFQTDTAQRAGRPLTDGEQYAAWGLGQGGFLAFAAAGRDADALTVYRQAAGARVADRAFETNGGLMRPGMTVGQVLDAYAARIGSGEPPRPTDWNGAYTWAAAATAHDPQLQASTLSEVSRRHTLENAQLASDRANLARQLEALKPALETGAQGMAIPEDEIMRLSPTREEGEAVIYRLRVSEAAGTMFRAVQWASPQELAAMRTSLTEGSGPLSSMLRGRLGIQADEAGVVPEQHRALDENARMQVGQVLDQRMRARNEALTADPAGFVAAEPGVRASLERARAENNPAAMQDYVAATLAAQARLGVPAHEQRVLSKTAAQDLAGRLVRGDPATENAADTLNQQARVYGGAWPRVFGDLVRDGGLPPAYQILAAIPSSVGQTDFTRMMQRVAGQGGADRLRQDAGSTAREYIRDNIDSALAGFRATTGAQGTSDAARLFGDVRIGVEQLALYYAVGGLDPRTAVSRAADRVLNDRYEFAGTARIPRGLGSQVETAQRVVTEGLRTTSLQIPSDMPGTSDVDKQATMLRLARRGQWVTNESDDGLVLTWEGQNGSRLPVRRVDGSRVEFSFRNMPTENALPDMELGGVRELREAFGPTVRQALDAAGAAVGAVRSAVPGMPQDQIDAIERNMSPAQRQGGRAAGQWASPGTAPAAAPAVPPPGADPVRTLAPGEQSRDAQGRQRQRGADQRGRWVPPGQ